jgi:hypothetical protein
VVTAHIEYASKMLKKYANKIRCVNSHAFLLSYVVFSPMCCLLSQ